MNHRKLIERTESFVKEKVGRNEPGHDWQHVDRVRNMALRIAKSEGGDPLVIELGALLHDVADHKFHGGDSTVGGNVAREFLASQNVEPDTIDRVAHIVEHISFKGAGEPNRIASLEGKIVQDADRLDAMGAIGVARCFSYGAKESRPLYDPEGVTVENATAEQNKNRKASSSLHHFYEKLLLLKDRMNTKTGKETAEGRHAFTEKYLEQFLAEWNGDR